MLLWLTACAWVQELTEPPGACDFSATEAPWDTTWEGTSAQEVREHWEGTTRYQALGGIYASTVQTPAEWGTGWTVTLESNSPPVMRESHDCGSHLSIPFSWTLALDNRGILQMDHGDQVQTKVDADGEVRVLGPRPEDWVVTLWSDENSTETSQAFQDTFYTDLNDWPTSLVFAGSGDLGMLSVYYLGDRQERISTELEGLVVERRGP